MGVPRLQGRGGRRGLELAGDLGVRWRQGAGWPRRGAGELVARRAGERVAASTHAAGKGPDGGLGAHVTALGKLTAGERGGRAAGDLGSREQVTVKRWHTGGRGQAVASVRSRRHGQATARAGRRPERAAGERAATGGAGGVRVWWSDGRAKRRAGERPMTA